MADYAVKITVRNGRLLKLMQDAGYPGASSLSRASGFGLHVINGYLSMKQSPRNADGEWRQTVYDLAAFLRCDPEDMFNPRQETLAISKNTQEVYLDEPELMTLTAGGDMQHATFAKITVERMLSTLPERTRDVVLRIAQGDSCETIAKDWGVSHGRIHQIECKALLKLRAQSQLSDKQVSQNIRFGIASARK